MTFLQIDPPAVRGLADSLRACADDYDGSTVALCAAFTLTGLSDPVTGRLGDRADRLTDSAGVLDARAAEVEAFVLGLTPYLPSGPIRLWETDGGSLLPSIDQADLLLRALLELGSAVTGIAGQQGPVAALLARRAELMALLEAVTGRSGSELAAMILVRGVDLLTDGLGRLGEFGEWIAEHPEWLMMDGGVDGLLRRRDALLLPILGALPGASSLAVAVNVVAGRSVAEAITAHGAHDDASGHESDDGGFGGLLDTWTRWRERGEDLVDRLPELFEDAFGDPITLDDLLGPVPFVPGEVVQNLTDLYERLLPIHEGGWPVTPGAPLGPDLSDWFPDGTLPDVGLPDVGLPDWVPDLPDISLDDLLDAAQWTTSFADGCLWGTGLVAPELPATGPAAPWVAGAACVGGGFIAAGVPGTDYDGIGPVLP